MKTIKAIVCLLVGTYIVNFNYTAKSSEELTIRKGDIITDVLPGENGWLKGKFQGNFGHFPENLVSLLPKEKTKKRTFVSIQTETKSGTRRKRSSTTVSTPSRNNVLFQVKVIYTYLPNHDDELSIKPNDIIDVTGLIENGWYEGILNGKAGLFPSNYVIRMNEDKHRIGQPIKQKSLDDRSTTVKYESTKKSSSLGKARVLYDYESRSNDELTLKKNDIVTIIDKSIGEDGWWQGEFNGRVGFFPDNYVEEILPLTIVKNRTNVPHNGTTKSSQTLLKLKPVDDELLHDFSNEPHSNTKSTSIHIEDGRISRIDNEARKPLDSSDKFNENDKLVSTSVINRPPSSLSKKQENEITKLNGSIDETNLSQSIDLKNGNKIHAPSPPTYQREPGQTESPRYINRSLAIANTNNFTSNSTSESLRTSLYTNEVNTEQLHQELLKLKRGMKEMKVKFADQIEDLIHELDEEKKIRATLQVEIERLQKLFQRSSYIHI